MSLKIGAVIQARSSSTRLPKKIFKELPYGSKTAVLSQVIRRLKKSKILNEIIVATTIQKEDQLTVNVAKKEKVKFFRGSLNDVLSRYYGAAKENKLDIIVRITSDCPCTDPHLVDEAIKIHIQSKADYTSNTVKRTYPHGLDVEVFNFNVLEQAFQEAKENFEREHVTPFFYRNPKRFKLAAIPAPKNFRIPDMRITLDTEADYALLCLIFDYFKTKPFFRIKDVVDLFNRKPWIAFINKNIVQKKVVYTTREEMDQAIQILDYQGLKRARNLLKAGMQK